MNNIRKQRPIQRRKILNLVFPQSRFRFVHNQFKFIHNQDSCRHFVFDRVLFHNSSEYFACYFILCVFVCLIYLSEGIVPAPWDAIFDNKTKKLRNSLGFNTSANIVYVSNG